MGDNNDNPFMLKWNSPERQNYEDYSITNIYIQMRDDVKIAATICLPKGLANGTKIPTLLFQTRYWRSSKLRIPFRWIFRETLINSPTPRLFTNRGYAVVYTDVRGCGASFGTRPYPFSKEENKDSPEIVDWIISQPWSDGNVVANGISYSGLSAELLATNNHPAVKAVMPGHSLWDAFTDIVAPGGCYNKAFMQMWSFMGKKLDHNDCTPMRQLIPIGWLLMKGVKPIDSDSNESLLKEAIKEHGSNVYVYELSNDKDFRDDLLPDGSTIDDISAFPHKKELEKSNVKVLSWVSWLDSAYVDSVINRFINLENPHIAIIGDWNHGASFPGNPLSPEKHKVSPSPKERITKWIDFFENIIYGEDIQGKTLYYYTMGEEKWKKTHSWPPEGMNRQKWYLTDGNTLSVSKPESQQGEDSYKINFRATSGRLNRWWTLLGLPIDYSNREKADKRLLCYTSPPLQENIEITGHATISLFLSSTHEDGAIYAYLEELDEEGNIHYFSDGNLRLLHRKISTEKPPYKILVPYHSYLKKDSTPIVPGEIVEATFAFRPTSVFIPKGHRLKLAIAGADKDTFKQYPPEGKPTIKIARNALNASFIDIPIKIRNEI